MAKRPSHRTEILVAVIGLIGVLGAALLANWEKIFLQSRSGSGDGATTSSGTAATSSFRAPEVTWAADGWEDYVNSPELTATNSKELDPGQSSPEAAVTHFYASFLREDQRFREVVAGYGERLNSAESEKLQRALEEYGRTPFKRVKLMSRKAISPTEYWIKVFLEVGVGSNIDSGTDEVEVRKIGNAWFVVSPPT